MAADEDPPTSDDTTRPCDESVVEKVGQRMDLPHDQWIRGDGATWLSDRFKGRHGITGRKR